MKLRLSLVVLAIVLAVPAFAQTPTPTPVPTTVSWVLQNQNRADRWNRARLKINKDTCNGVGLPATCTQAQARNVNPQANIYSSISDLFDRQVEKEAFNRLRAAADAVDLEDFCSSWWADNASTRNAWCAARNLPNGCAPCAQPTP